MARRLQYPLTMQTQTEATAKFRYPDDSYALSRAFAPTSLQKLWLERRDGCQIRAWHVVGETCPCCGTDYDGLVAPE